MKDTLIAAMFIAAALCIGMYAGYLLGSPLARLGLKTELAAFGQRVSIIGRWLTTPIGEPKPATEEYIGRHRLEDAPATEPPGLKTELGLA